MSPRRKLGEVLVEAGLVDEFQLRSALSDQKRWGRPLGITLIKLGFVEEDELVRVLSRQLDVPIVDLHGKRIAPDALGLLPADVAEQYHCVPLFTKREGGRDTLYLGMEDPTDLRALDDLSFRTGMQIRPVLVGPTQLAEAFERYYRSLEYSGDGAAGDSLAETPEPGDTAPLVFTPTMPGRTAPVAGPEPALRADERLPAAVQRPPAELGDELEFHLDDEPEPELELDEELPPAVARKPDIPPVSPPPPARTAPRTAPQAPPAAAASVACSESREPAGSAAAAKPREVPTRTILRAVTQLLVDEGIIAREDLMERIRVLSESGESS